MTQDAAPDKFETPPKPTEQRTFRRLNTGRANIVYDLADDVVCVLDADHFDDVHHICPARDLIVLDDTQDPKTREMLEVGQDAVGDAKVVHWAKGWATMDRNQGHMRWPWVRKAHADAH